MKIFEIIVRCAALILIMAAIGLSGCSKETDEPTPEFKEVAVDLGTHQLKAYSYSNNSKYLVVFESGLGDDHGVWKVKNIPSRISASADVLLYDRAGYGRSDKITNSRGISRLADELNQVIDRLANGKKVVLVGHSLGGMIIRDYAIKHPTKTAALLFVDSSHELSNNPTQEEEDEAYDLFKGEYGANYGGTLEIRELVENVQYLATLPNLPDIPVIALTSMRIDAENDAEDKQLWYDSKEALKRGVSDFTHITTTKSGHYIMLTEPELVIENIELLLSKLP